MCCWIPPYIYISVSFSGKLKWSVERFSVSRVENFYPFNSDFKNQDIENRGLEIFKILDFKWNLSVWNLGVEIFSVNRVQHFLLFLNFIQNLRYHIENEGLRYNIKSLEIIIRNVWL